jgi:hypothetical protein
MKNDGKKATPRGAAAFCRFKIVLVFSSFINLFD